MNLVAKLCMSCILLLSTIVYRSLQPNTYMEQFCKALHPDLGLDKVCVSWFREAIKHCTDLLSDVRAPTAYFWTTVKNFIFPDRTTHMMSLKAPISIHPKRLSVHDCQLLFSDIVSDYVERAPRYAAESATNNMLWQLLYSIWGIMTLGTLFLGTVYAYYKYGQSKSIPNVLEEVFKPHKRMQAVAARSIRLAKTELRILKTKQMARKEHVIAGDGSDMLVLKVSSKYEFLESVVQGCIQSVGKFHRLYEDQDKSKTGFKVESLNKAMKFVDNNCHKLHMVIMFEEDKHLAVEEAVEKYRKKSLSPPARTSPRFTGSNTKEVPRLEGGNVAQKAPAGPNAVGNKSRSSTPNQLNTPRSTNTPRSFSGIPRNVQKASPSTRKSNQY